MRKKSKEKVTLTLKSSAIYNDAGIFVGGGILNTVEHVDTGIWGEIMEDPVWDQETNQWGVTGRLQIHLGSTRQALEELGTFLISLAHYRPPQPGYSAHFELKDYKGVPLLHLIIHLPVDSVEDKVSFEKVHNVASAIVRSDNTIQLTTLPASSSDKEE